MIAQDKYFINHINTSITFTQAQKKNSNNASSIRLHGHCRDALVEEIPYLHDGSGSKSQHSAQASRFLLTPPPGPKQRGKKGRIQLWDGDGGLRRP